MYENENYTQSDYSTYQTSNSTFDGSYYNQQNTGGKQPKKKGSVVKKLFFAVSLGLLFGLFAGAGFYGVVQVTGVLNQEADVVVADTKDEEKNEDASKDKEAEEKSDSGIKLANTNNITFIESDVSNVVEEVMPAMVSIINNYTETTQYWGQTYSQEQESSGSGIIVAESESELLMVSNNHVVEGADQLFVTFIDGSEAQAHIKGRDAEMDLAVIAVSLEDLSEETKSNISIATLGDSDSLKLGMPVIAIGNALGYGQSVTTGIVSALDREVTFDDGSMGTYIQTDAAINPGNSGGALLNINGEVIGINSSKIGGSIIEGMGYAIPITSASPIISDLMERQTRTDKVENAGYLGITPQTVPAQMSQIYNMPQGVYVADVEKDSVADDAGLMTGDIITEFDGSKIVSEEELRSTLQYYAAGETIEITVMRPERGEYVEYTIEITLGSRPE